MIMEQVVDVSIVHGGDKANASGWVCQCVVWMTAKNGAPHLSVTTPPTKTAWRAHVVVKSSIKDFAIMITEQVVFVSLVQKREQRDATGWVCLGVVRMTAEHGALHWATQRQSRQGQRHVQVSRIGSDAIKSERV